MFKPQRLGTVTIPDAELTTDKKNCKKIIVEEFQNRYKKYYLKIKNNEGYSALFYKIILTVEMRCDIMECIL